MLNCHETKILSHSVIEFGGCCCNKDQACGLILSPGTGAHQADLCFQKCYTLDPSEVLALDLSALEIDEATGATIDIVAVKEFMLGNGAPVTQPSSDVTFTPGTWAGPTGAAFTVMAGGCFYDSAPVVGFATGDTFTLTNTDAVNTLTICVKIVGVSE